MLHHLYTLIPHAWSIDPRSIRRVCVFNFTIHLCLNLIILIDHHHLHIELALGESTHYAAYHFSDASQLVVSLDECLLDRRALLDLLFELVSEFLDLPLVHPSRLVVQQLGLEIEHLCLEFLILIVECVMRVPSS